MSGSAIVNLRKKKGITIGTIVSYFVFLLWTVITIAPLFWLFYSSFKSNEEITRDVYKFPHALFDNKNDEYEVIKRELNVIPTYDEEKDTRPRLIIESVEIMPQRRYMVFFLLKEKLPPEIANLKVGERIKLNQLPAAMQLDISWKTIWFNYWSSFTRGGLGVKFFNSLLYSSIGTLFIVMLGLMTGFALSKMKFPKLSIVIGAAFGLGNLITISSVIIPLYLMLKAVNLINSQVGIIVVYIAFGLPMAVLLSTQFIRGLPDSLIESAYIDGAGMMRTFFSIIAPMSIPVATTVAIINALGIWNEFLLVQVIASDEKIKSLPVGVFSFASQTSTQFGWQLAAMVMAVLPAMIVYFMFNKRIAQGVVAGAIKG